MGFLSRLAQLIKSNINDLINKRLRGELSRCNNCSMACGDLPIPK